MASYGRFDNAEREEESMEVDRAITKVEPLVQQCTEGPGETPYGIKQSYHFNTKKRSLADIARFFLMNTKMYEAKEPIGCAMILGSNKVAGSAQLFVSKDVDMMKDTLEDGGWEMMCVHSELKRDELSVALSGLKQQCNHKDYSAFFFYYTGHGVAEGVVLNDGNMVEYTDIVNIVSNIRALEGKPKIFVFDCCKVRQRNEGPYSRDRQRYTAPKRLFNQEIRNHQKMYPDSYPPPDCLICFSASEGCPSFMDESEGSYYTIVLSNALRQLGKSLSLTEIILQVCGGTYEVARYRGDDQHPFFLSTLNKGLILNRKYAIFIGAW